ncbi:hypothetical protein DYB30_007120 [Aphanomyces astaci]|uniref:HIT-type domain-containing protein n=1 Tax=Aphanomyces astaci TaxID=112090 RepID=A0A397B2F6_APHAT|nr:hypothetical protein DYB36_007698 [Aphanomyces astaci]RHY40093.1 hypothetical protein DYB30_007120 [Aphanomyces astaci]RHZ32796.1 hypothetical protein DYB31_009301 [Aphanomyces astaci]
MSAKNAKRQWDQTMASSGLAVPGSAKVSRKRFSGRTVKISKAMKHVDEETRRQVRNARLDALEADNYMESTDGADEDMFVLDDDDDAKKPTKPKSKAKANKHQVPQALGRHRMVRKCGDGMSSTDINYVTAAVKPAKTPPRHFCCVCGLLSSYTCGRCGSKFCCVRCGNQHKDTGCLKFNM